ncbi:MAG: DUF1206 domain-containing protein [Sphingobacteriales bacterium]|nr:MAG: DUF1206 domain-containing protein [Sphingobacteriales bacterium]
MVDKSEKFTLLVRVGYAARGVVYILLGYLALSSSANVAAGPQASLDFLQDIPLGGPILSVAAAGLLAYAIYKFIAAVSDLERLGTTAKGVAHRVGYFCSGLAHSVLAWTAVEFARGNKQSATGDGSNQAAGSLLSWEAGSVILGMVGIGFFLGAIVQGKKAVTADFMRSVGAGAPGSVCWIGRCGHAARSMVFLLIGWSLIKSAWLHSGSEVKGLGTALMSLRDDGGLYTIVAIGLLLFGVFSLIVARFLFIPDIDRSDLKPGIR